MNRKEPQFRAPFFGTGEIALCGDPAVTLGDRSWKPDDTAAYIKFCLSFAFPNVSNYGDGIHAGVIGRCFNTLESKPVNSNHKMAAYGASGDSIIGTVVGVQYPAAPDGGWKTTKERKAAPNITGVAALWLNAQETEQWISRYESKRKNVAVSMEVIYAYATCGFAVSRGPKSEGRIEGSQTSDEFWEAGWEYVPMSALLTPAQLELDSKDIMRLAGSAPAGSLLRTRDFKAKRMIGGNLLTTGLCGSWTPKDGTTREVYFMQGGIDGVVFYPGMGLVERGAEQKAAIETMLASDEEAMEFERGIAAVTEIVREAKQEL